jgi:2-polyprenyl-3-methyl-5-hydroxy-6-metoxy-1,4-benzoquinol methylase
MRFVPIDPPGTLCTYEALKDFLKRTQARNFIDVGCGAGGTSKLLCSLGMPGRGIDFSRTAIEAAKRTLQAEIADGVYELIEGDVTTLDTVPSAELGVSVMVMEHVADDVAFVRTLIRLVKTGGYVAICVPGRKDCWSFEDETAGHFRRYDRDDLYRVLQAGGLEDLEVWSVAVPTANVLLRIGAWLVRRSNQAEKIGLNQREQTETSGVRDIPWKTVFPFWVKIILNRYTLSPLLALQRLFYRTGRGVTMLGFGRVP